MLLRKLVITEMRSTTNFILFPPPPPKKNKNTISLSIFFLLKLTTDIFISFFFPYTVLLIFNEYSTETHKPEPSIQ